jgi:glutathione S-transferase
VLAYGARTMIQVYGTARSTCSRKVLTALHETNTPFELNVIDFSKREHKQEPHLSRQPFGQIPAIDDEGFKLFESRAILRYLSAMNGDMLTPSTVKERALMDQWASVEQSNFSPNAMKFVYHYTFNRPQEQAVLEAALGMLTTCFSALSVPLAKQPYLSGEKFSLADIGYMPYLQFLKDTPVNDKLQLFPEVVAWWERLRARDSWLKVLALSV